MSESFVALRVLLPDHPPAPAQGDVLGRLVETARSCEQAGADAVFVARPLSSTAKLAVDPYVVLGAIAGATESVLLGFVAAALDERSPAMLAKVVTALDVCSWGRALCVLGPPENDALSLEAFAEALEVLRALARVEKPSFSGKHFVLRDAWNEPRSDIRPFPVGIFVPKSRETRVVSDEQADALLALAQRFGEYAFVEVDASLESPRLPDALGVQIRQAGRLAGDVRLIGSAFASFDDPAQSARLARDLRRVGFDGVVIDVPTAQLGAHVAALREGLAGSS